MMRNMYMWSRLYKLHLFRRLRYSIGLAVVAVLALAGIVSAAETFWDYCSGNANGIGWTGSGYLTWDTGNNGVVYWGTSYTNASQAPDYIRTASWGRELCYFVVTDTEWDNSDLQYGDSSVEAPGGSGWVMLGQCGGFSNVTVSNQGSHLVVHDYATDGTTDAYDYLPW